MGGFETEMFSTPTILISCRNTVLFFAYIEIRNFPKGTAFANTLYFRQTVAKACVSGCFFNSIRNIRTEILALVLNKNCA